MRRNGWGRVLQVLLLLGGLTLLGVIVYRVGPAKLWQQITAFGIGLVIFVALEFVSDCFHAIGTAHCFSREGRRPPLLNLFYMRRTSMAYNFITPTSGFGGEVVKAMMLERYVSRSEAASVVIIDKFASGITQFTMAFVGSAVIVTWTSLEMGLKIAFWAASAIMAGGFVGFLVCQHQGWFSGFCARVVGVVAGQRGRDWVANNLAPLDQQLRTYYQKQRKDLVLTICWHALAYTTGIVQAWLFLHVVLGQGDWVKASAIWCMGTWFDTILFMVPAALGTQELSRALIFERAIGFGWAEGVAFSMVLRINEIVPTAVGFVTHALEMASRRPVEVPELERAQTPPHG